MEGKQAVADGHLAVGLRKYKTAMVTLPEVNALKLGRVSVSVSVFAPMNEQRQQQKERRDCSIAGAVAWSQSPTIINIPLFSSVN